MSILTYFKGFNSIINRNGVKALETDKNRHRSIYNGVKALETGKPFQGL
jgi:hypothetical protein